MKIIGTSSRDARFMEKLADGPMENCIIAMLEGKFPALTQRLSENVD